MAYQKPLGNQIPNDSDNILLGVKKVLKTGIVMSWTDILLSDARKHKVVLPVGTFFSNETIQLKEKTIFMAVYRGETFFVNRHGNRLLRGGKGSGKCDAGVYTYVREGKRAKADDIHKFENYYGTLQHT